MTIENKDTLSAEELAELKEAGIEVVEGDLLDEGCDDKKSDEDEGKKSDEDEGKKSDEDDSDEDDSDEDEEESMDESVISQALEQIAEGFIFEADQEALGSLLESEEFDEEFKQKALTVFEAAVTSTAQKHMKTVLETAQTVIESALEERYNQLDEEIDEYLDYVTSKWLEENKIAVESGLRLENAESFMLGMKELLETHYVEVPEDKEDLFAAAIEESAHLENVVSEAIEENVQLQKEVGQLKRALVIESFTRGLTDVKAERLKELSEGLQFESEEQFQEVLETLSENFLTEPKGNLQESTITDSIDESELNKGKVVLESDEGDEIAKLAAQVSRFAKR